MVRIRIRTCMALFHQARPLIRSTLADKIAYDKAGSDATDEQLAAALKGITVSHFHKG